MPQAPQITLYLRPGWSNMFAHMLLNEQNIDFCTIGVTDRTVTEDTNYAAQNPKKQIPVLFIDNQVVTENPAIAHAIHLLKPETELFGRNVKEFVKVCEWLNWISASLHAQAWSPYLRPWRFTTAAEGEEAVKAKAYEKLLERFAMVESWLPDVYDKTFWAVGEDFTAVDAYLYPFWRWADQGWNLDLSNMFPRFCRLMRNVQDRESFKKTARREYRILKEMGGEEAFERNR